MSFDKVKYDDEYKRENYDRIVILVPKGKKDELRDIASDKHISLTELIIHALEKQYHIFIK